LYVCYNSLKRIFMEEKECFDVVVIGAGPGGYVAAIKAAQLGRKVALIEKENVGGTCLNVGCIPTKTLIASATLWDFMQKSSEFGIIAKELSFDFAQMQSRKEGVVTKMRKSLAGLIRSNGINIIQGAAEFISPKELKIKGERNFFVRGEKIIIASGSEPMEVPAFPCDGKRIFNSTSILTLSKLPKSLVIIGGGYIGCEFASLYAKLGVKITIVEAESSIVLGQGKAVAEALTAAFVADGIEILTNNFVEGIDSGESGVVVRLKSGAAIEAEISLIAIGRRVVSSSLGLEKAAIATSAKGEIVVNEKMETGVLGVYAIGDVTGKAMLAHVASHQGIVAAMNACGERGSINYDTIPCVIFTFPEIATVGLSEEVAVARGHAVSCGKYPFKALGKSLATGHAQGFAQIVINKASGQILGAQVVGVEASSLIAEMTLAIANELTVESLIDTIHAHPTLPEVWVEAAFLAMGCPLHYPPRMKS
jgi:dihydrolipoamide dehydrogenase